MRILYICDALAIYGGLERILVDKLNELSERYKYELFLITANQGQHPIPFPLNPKVTFYDLNIIFHRQYYVRGFKRLWTKYKLYRLFIRKLRQQIQKIQPEIIVCVRINYLADVLKVSGEIPVIFESHTSRSEFLFAKLPFYRHFFLRYWQHAVADAYKVVALTEGDAKAWSEINPSVCVIPNVVHLNESGYYSDCQDKSAIFVGRFSEQKDIRSLLQIWEIVHHRYPEWVLNIYGGYGEEKDELMPLLEQGGNGIRVHKPTPDIFDRYVDSSMLLLTSLYEPFGLVLPEAMSCGLPVISFDCPYGPADIITDGVDGFLIKDRNIEAFADKVCLLIDNPQLRRDMGKAGIQSSQRYHANQIMPQWQAFFSKIIISLQE